MWAYALNVDLLLRLRRVVGQADYQLEDPKLELLLITILI
jgi:hypothetical protein